MGALVVALTPQLVRIGMTLYSGTVYIKSDGSIYPADAPLTTTDNITYTLTDNISGAIVIERDNIIINGSGYVVQGLGSGTGIDASNRNNVTIKNIVVENFSKCIDASYSSNIKIIGNNLITKGDYGIYVYSTSYIIIKENNIIESEHCGIFISASSDIRIERNNVTNAANTKYLNYGIYFATSCSNITITENNITRNDYGIYAEGDSDITITKNIFLNNSESAFRLYKASNVKAIENDMRYNHGGASLRKSKSAIVRKNTFFNNTCNLYSYSSSNITITENNITKGKYGMYFYESSNITITKNICFNNTYGVYLYYSSNITVTENNITRNDNGVYLEGASNNVFYHNNFIYNTLQVNICVSGINIWDNGYSGGGNYWSDYAGVDKYSGVKQNKPGVDGIGDTPYIIDENNTDRYPLMKPWKTMIWTVPSSGPSGTKVTVLGNDFSPGSNVTISFNDMPIGSTVCKAGRFVFTFNIPVSSAGGQLIKAHDDKGKCANTTFTVIDETSLSLQVEVGTVHFRGEIAEFYVLTSFKGEPVNVTITEATLYYSGGSLTKDLTSSIEQIATGLYRIPYEIPSNAPEGTYTLFVKAEYVTSTVSSKGVSFKSFQLSSTLTNWNAYLINIKDDVGVIKTDVGNIKVKLDGLNATIIALRGDIAVLNTTLGEIKTKIEDLNVTLVDVKNDVILIKTTLGEIKVKLEDLNATLIATALNVEDIVGTVNSWTGVTANVSGHVLLALTSAELVKKPVVTDSVVSFVVSGSEGTSGVTLIVIQKELLETLSTTADDIVVLIDGKSVEFETSEHSTYYLIKVFYTHSEHTVTIHLTGKLDSDSDGVPNWKEYVSGTNPAKPDTDGDIWKDSIDPWPTSPLLPNGIIVAILALSVVLTLVIRKRRSIALRNFASKNSKTGVSQQFNS